MATKNTARGAEPRAGCDWLEASTHSVNSLSDLQVQRLVRDYHINPALAPTIAALAWQAVRPLA